MHTHSGVAHIILDFDGTCTQIPPIFEKYLDFYRKGLNEIGTECNAVGMAGRAGDRSPSIRQRQDGRWLDVPSAPAAGDPYVLADEAARLILRRRGATTPVPPLSMHGLTTLRSPPGEKKHAIRFRGSWSMAFNLHFVSNSGTAFISRRLRDLFGDNSPVTAKISVQSDAGKFRICELNWQNPWFREVH